MSTVVLKMCHFRAWPSEDIWKLIFCEVNFEPFSIWTPKYCYVITHRFLDVASLKIKGGGGNFLRFERWKRSSIRGHL